MEKTADGRQESRLIERDGPTGVIMTTTAVSLHPETQTRFISIPVSDSPAQTKRVMLAEANSTNGECKSPDLSAELERWHAFQEWIAGAEHRVVIPYAQALAELFPPVAVRLRRDFKALLSLIKAHAILHQTNRRRDERHRIVAKLADYRVVRSLVNDLISQGVEQTVSATIRQTVGAVNDAKGEGLAVSTILQIAQTLHIDRSSASRRVTQCLKRGYLRNIETMRGRPYRLALGDPLPEEEHVMPTKKEILRRWKKIG